MVGKDNKLVTQNSIFHAALQRNRQEGHWHYDPDIRGMNEEYRAEGISLSKKLLARLGGTRTFSMFRVHILRLFLYQYNLFRRKIVYFYFYKKIKKKVNIG